MFKNSMLSRIDRLSDRLIDIRFVRDADPEARVEWMDRNAEELRDCLLQTLLLLRDMADKGTTR